MQKLNKFIRKLQVRRFAILYLTLTVVLLLITVLLTIKPSLEKSSGWLGIRVQRDSATGTVRIREVIAESPAYDVGILNGDMILSYKGIAVSDINTLKQLIRDSYVKEQVRIILERDGERLVADTRIAKKPKHVTILPPVLSIVQGASPPHADRGLCVRCHTIVPRNQHSRSRQ